MISTDVQFFQLPPYFHVTIFFNNPTIFYNTSLAMQSVVHNLSIYITQDCRDVILNTNHGFTIVATIRLDERGDCYFGTGFWKEIPKFYVLRLAL